MLNSLIPSMLPNLRACASRRTSASSKIWNLIWLGLRTLDPIEAIGQYGERMIGVATSAFDIFLERGRKLDIGRLRLRRSDT